MTFAEQIADHTWERINRSRKYRVRLGEETLTDILILDLVGCGASRRFRLHQPTKVEESRTGADLEIWIRVGRSSSAVHLVIQAKKLGSEGRYDQLNPNAGGGNPRQIDRLDHHARCANAIPLYLFYNDVDNLEASSCWHCCQQPCNERQTGCTLVPSWRVRDALRHRGSRTFRGLHHLVHPWNGQNRRGSALPWRCYFDCNEGIGSILERLRSSHELFLSRRFAVTAHERYGQLRFAAKENEWPDWLWSRDDGGLLSRRDLAQLYGEHMPAGIVDSKKLPRTLESDLMPALLPRWILLVDPSMEEPVRASTQG